MKTIILVFTLALIVNAQDSTCYNLFFIQPNGFLYFDMGDDSPDKADFYQDGSTAISLQMLGFDWYFADLSEKIRLGLSAGLGLSVANSDDPLGSFGMLNLGMVVSFFDDKIRLESGYMLGYTAKESLKEKQDAAIYVGFSFPTKVSDIISDVF